jgi:hypothetical protein
MPAARARFLIAPALAFAVEPCHLAAKNDTSFGCIVTRSESARQQSAPHCAKKGRKAFQGSTAPPALPRRPLLANLPALLPACAIFRSGLSLIRPTNQAKKNPAEELAKE